MSEYLYYVCVCVCVFIPIISGKGNYIYRYIKTKYFLDSLKQIIINCSEWLYLLTKVILL